MSRFGVALKAELRAPLGSLIADPATLCLFKPGEVAAVGETTLAECKTRPDHAVRIRHPLIGFIEVKASAPHAGQHDP